MTEEILAEGAIEVGHHTTATWLGMTVNTDTVYATALAAVITLAPTFVQVNSILWRYIRSIHEHYPGKLRGEVYDTPNWKVNAD